MRLRWEYDLPAPEQDMLGDFEGPIVVAQGRVHFVTSAYQFPPEVRADDAAKRGEIIQLHRVEVRTGVGEVTAAEVSRALGATEWSFIQAGQQLVLHTGHFHAVQGGRLERLAWPYVEVERRPGWNGRGAFVRVGNGLIFAGAAGDAPPLPDDLEDLTPEPEGWVILTLNRGESFLYCYDLDALTERWALAMDTTPPRDQYRIAAPALLGDRVVCFGREGLNWVNPASGEITDQLHLPRVDKLFAPLMDGPDLLLPYTNWTTGGVIRYSPARRKVLWKYSRRQYVGEAQGELVRYGGLVIWVKGGTEIVALDVTTGEQTWTVKADPWLYTGLDLHGDGLIFGTSGRNGALYRVNAQTGAIAWRHFIEGGCAYLTYYQESVLAGDDAGAIRRVDAVSGELLDLELFDGSAIVGDMLVYEDVLTTVLGPSEEKPARLVCIELA